MYKNLFEYFKNNNTIKLNIIVGPYSPNILNKDLNYFKDFKNIKLFFSPNNIDKILVKTHLLLSTAGLMMYEASRYDVTSIFFKINKNQEFNSNFLKFINQIFILNYNQVSSKKLLILINLIISKFYIIKKEFFIKQKIFLGYKKVIHKIINNEN
jgi:spore coat polysaccharide biosynthesis predicted glycosyltransferase SpsG